MSTRRRWLPLAAIGMLVTGSGVRAEDDWERCTGSVAMQRIEACSRLIENGGLAVEEQSLAYAMRALGRSLLGRHDLAIPDYDAAIRLDPDFAAALNNRAWALYKSGRPEAGVDDVERALKLTPLSPHALDTRAHIRQALGEPAGALADYQLAMRAGGERVVKLYQCGLQMRGLYEGPVDGLVTTGLRRALATCVETDGCDPLPPDEECRDITS